MGKHTATHVLIVEDPSSISSERYLFATKDWWDLVDKEARTWIGSNNGRLFRDWANHLDLSQLIHQTEIAGCRYTVRQLNVA